MIPYLVVAVTLFSVSAAALVLRRHPLVKLLALNLMGISVFLWLTAGARLGELPDAVPHALVLTGIVVAVSATAFGLMLIVKLDQHQRRDES